MMGMSELLPELRGPVGLALAKAVETIPSAGSMPGGAWYEPKGDGVRGAMVVARKPLACGHVRART
jgi:hypothetical protein